MEQIHFITRTSCFVEVPGLVFHLHFVTHSALQQPNLAGLPAASETCDHWPPQDFYISCPSWHNPSNLLRLEMGTKSILLQNLGGLALLLLEFDINIIKAWVVHYVYSKFQ